MQFSNDPKLKITEGGSFILANHHTNYTGTISSEKEADKILKKATKKIYEEQRKLYAADNHSLLCIFQAVPRLPLEMQ